jgi:hypothetical protein
MSTAWEELGPYLMHDVLSTEWNEATPRRQVVREDRGTPRRTVTELASTRRSSTHVSGAPSGYTRSSGLPPEIAWRYSTSSPTSSCRHCRAIATTGAGGDGRSERRSRPLNRDRPIRSATRRRVDSAPLPTHAVKSTARGSGEHEYPESALQELLDKRAIEEWLCRCAHHGSARP